MKKKIIFHVGAPKTGTSAIQAFLSQNTRILLEHDIYYPWPESEVVISEGACSGNLLTKIIELSKSSGESLDSLASTICSNFRAAVVEAAESSPASNILFSGEFMMERKPGFLIGEMRDLSKNYDVQIIAYIRDPYDHFISDWKQKVKAGYAKYLGEFFMEQIPSGAFLMKQIAAFVDSELPTKIISYDANKSDLISVFLMELNSSISAEKSNKNSKKHNLSLSLPQAILLVMSTRVLGDSRLNAALCNAYLKSGILPQYSDPYIPSIDRLIRKHCMFEISKVNSLLPNESKIRVDADSSEADPSIQFNSKDIEIFFQVLDQVRKFGKLVPPPANLIEKGLPVDFDPIEYLLRHRDVRKAGVNPFEHFLNHGQYEGRKYKSDN